MVHYTPEMLSQSPWWEKCRSTGRSLNADGVSYQAYYSEVGKAHHMGKDLTEVRRDGQRQDLADARNGFEQIKIVRIMLASDPFNLVLQRFDQPVECIDHGQIGRNGQVHRWILKAPGYRLMIEFA